MGRTHGKDGRRPCPEENIPRTNDWPQTNKKTWNKCLIEDMRMQEMEPMEWMDVAEVTEGIFLERSWVFMWPNDPWRE